MCVVHVHSGRYLFVFILGAYVDASQVLDKLQCAHYYESNTVFQIQNLYYNNLCCKPFIASVVECVAEV